MMRSRSRAQGGFTLIEILLTIAIAGIILAPVGSWMILTLTSHAETAGRFSDAAQTRLLETYIQRDVSSAEMINDGTIPPPPPMEDCAGGDGNNLVLGLWFLGTEARRVVYKVQLVDGADALVRVECSLGQGANPRSQTIVHGLSGPNAVTAVCTGGDAENPCKTVTVDAALISGATLHTEATRRGTKAFLTGGIGGASPPYITSIGDVEVKPRTPDTPYEVTVSADVFYFGGDPSELTFTWSTSSGGTLINQSPPTGGQPLHKATFSFPNPGEVQVFLKVSDPYGNADTASRSVSLVNRDPIVRSVSITLDPGATVGIEEFTKYTFTANFEDPDSHVANIEWILPGLVDPDDLVTPVDPTANPVTGVFKVNPFPNPDGPDYRSVALAVVDAEGGEGSWSADIQIRPGGASTTFFPQGTDVNQDPPVIHVTQPEGMTGLHLEIRPSNPAVFLDWEMVKPDLTSVGFDPPTPDGVWYYPIELTSGSGKYIITQHTIIGNVVDEVWVNTVPESKFSWGPPTSLPATVTFTDTSVDYDGTVETVLWDFGSLGTFNGPSATVTFTDPGDYILKLTVTDDKGGSGTLTRGIRCTSGGCGNFDV